MLIWCMTPVSSPGRTLVVPQLQSFWNSYCGPNVDLEGKWKAVEKWDAMQCQLSRMKLEETFVNEEVKCEVNLGSPIEENFVT
jgi:hypothetical protein